MFKQKSAPPKGSLHEWQDRLDALIAAGRAGGVDLRDLADLLEGRSTAVRMAWVTNAPVDASMH